MTTDGDQPLTLREVAQTALDRAGVSGRALDRMARERGLKIVYTTINHMAAGTYRSRPSRATLDALSALSGYSQEQVYAAAGQPFPLAPFSEQLPPDVDLLDGPQREAILAVVRQFVAANRALHDARGGGERDSSAPKTQAGGAGDLPTVAEQRAARRRRALEQGFPAETAAYDGSDEDPEG